MKILGIVAVDVVRESRKFLGHPYVGRIARSSLHSTAFLSALPLHVLQFHVLYFHVLHFQRPLLVTSLTHIASSLKSSLIKPQAYAIRFQLQDQWLPMAGNVAFKDKA